MTTPDDRAHEEFAQLAAGFAISALEPGDEQAFLEHLPTCEQCATALLEHSTTLGHLAFAASNAEPPASILERIRAGIRTADGLRPVEAPAAVASLTDARAKRAGRTVRLSSALIGVAASLILALGLVFVSGGVGGKQPKASGVAFDKILQQQLVPGARTVSMEGDGRAVAVINGARISLVVAGMPVNDKKKSIYVLWARSRYGGVRAVGTFDVPSSKALAIANLGTVNPSTLLELMVTREVGRRAPASTTQQPVLSVLAGQL